VRAWISGAGGMVVGLALQLLIIPIAATNPALNAGDPSNWARFYDYVSLGQYGGGWLVQFYPRHGPLWSVQVMDLIRAFGANFLWLTGRLGVLGILPALFGLLGLFQLWQRNRRLATAWRPCWSFTRPSPSGTSTSQNISFVLSTGTTSPCS